VGASGNHLEMATETPVGDLPDADLVRHAAAGDREAFGEIYRRYHSVVYRFARMMAGSASVAEDVTQEAFVALIRDLHRYRPQRAGLATYLYGVARNLTRSRLRRERRFVRFVSVKWHEPLAPDDPSATLVESQERTRLRRAIAALPPRYREVVVLCAIHGLSYAEAAAIVGAPVGTVRSRLNRGRRAIAVRLRAEEDSRGVMHEQADRAVG
jgi:RNA polymerase sigma-70 factor (ECF subfamily)